MWKRDRESETREERGTILLQVDSFGRKQEHKDIAKTQWNRVKPPQSLTDDQKTNHFACCLAERLAAL